MDKKFGYLYTDVVKFFALIWVKTSETDGIFENRKQKQAMLNN